MRRTRFIKGEYVLDVWFIVRMSHRYVLEVQVHYQNVAKTFKIKSEAATITH
jgi:hypothetical protein